MTNHFLVIALFEDGDVPGERLFSFNSKQTKTSMSFQKTPTSLKTSTKNVASSQLEKNQDFNKDNEKVYNIHPQGILNNYQK